MKKFPILLTFSRALLSLVLWILNKILTALYLCLPVGLFFALMQLREKNNKGNAISTFVDDKSEFQFIYPDYILVSNKPNAFKKDMNKKISNVNSFLEKYKWALLIGLVGLILLSVIVLVNKF